MNIFNDYDMIP